MNFATQLSIQNYMNLFKVRIVGKGFLAKVANKDDFCFVECIENALPFSRSDAFHSASHLYDVAGHPAIIVDRNTKHVHTFGSVH